MIEFESAVRYNGELTSRSLFEQSDIKNEPMLFNCDYRHAYTIGGSITRLFLNCLPLDWIAGPLIIDSRAHMLMKGWYPCIPGWHHDDVPRTRADGQPNYFDNSIRSEHVMMLVNAGVCPTEFALGRFRMEIPEQDTIYRVWDETLEYEYKNLRRVSCPNQTLVFFDDRTFHRGVPAVKDGWRFFIRASRHFNAKGERIERGDGWKNEQRKQVQVYIDPINKGW